MTGSLQHSKQILEVLYFSHRYAMKQENNYSEFLQSKGSIFGSFDIVVFPIIKIFSPHMERGDEKKKTLKVCFSLAKVQSHKLRCPEVEPEAMIRVSGGLESQ